MSEREKNLMIYVVIVNCLILIALGFIHLLFLSPLCKETLSLDSNLKTLEEKEKAVAKDLAAHLRDKESVKKQFDGLLAFANDNFCTLSVEIIQRSIASAMSDALPALPAITGFSMRNMSGLRTVFVSADFSKAKAKDVFAFFKAVSKKHFAVSDSLTISELKSDEVSVRYDFYVPFAASAAGLSKGGL